ADTRYFSVLWQGITETFRNRVLLEVILLGSFMGGIYGCLEEYVPLFFRQGGYSYTTITLIVGITVLVAAFASFAAHRYNHFKTTTFLLLLAASGVLLYAAGLLSG